MGAFEIGLSALQVYFLLMNFTVERFYCHSEFKRGDTRFLVQETIDFCSKNNRLFLQRPLWMVNATCISAYVLSVGYLFILYVIWTRGWRRFAIPLLLFIGGKLNAIGFYHLMEFTSEIPPENLLAYFSVEGPYLVSMALILWRVASVLGAAEPSPKTRKA